jgi:hypothetical protein
VVKKMLHSVPEKLEQVAISMETLLDLNSLLIEEATSHLLVVEQRRKKGAATPAADAKGRLLLTEEEWAACMKAKEKGDSSGGGSSGGGGDHGRGHGRGKGCDGGRNGGANSNSREDTMACGACHNCGKMGHYAHECWSKKKGEAHMAQDDEPSLLLVEAGDVNTTLFSSPPPATAVSIYSSDAPSKKFGGYDMLGDGSDGSGHAAGDIVHLVEDKVVALLSDEEKEECPMWVLDTGATNHMTGCKSAFLDLNHNVHETVKFRDGSVVRIEGMGTVMFNCKNDEHHAFVGVYYIPKLNTNIIRVG